MIDNETNVHYRLHELERVREKELELHRKEVESYKQQTSSANRNAQELLLEVAKLRTRNCQLEGELKARISRIEQADIDAKLAREAYEQNMEQLQGQHAVLSDEKRALQLDMDQLSKNETIHKAQIQYTELQIHGLNQEKEALRVSLQEKQSQIQEQSIEICSLKSEANERDDEIKSLRHTTEKLQAQVEEQTRYTHNLKDEGRLMEQELNRVLQTRSRLFNWKQNQLIHQESFMTMQSLFGGWKLLMMQSKEAAIAQMRKDCTHRQEKLHEYGESLNEKAKDMTSMMKLIKNEISNYPRELAIYQHDVLHYLRQMSTACKQREDRCALEVRLCQKKAADKVKEIEKELANMQSTVRGLLKMSARGRSRTIRHKVFQAWKSVRLQNAIAQTTHLAMLYRQKASVLENNENLKTVFQSPYQAPKLQQNAGLTQPIWPQRGNQNDSSSNWYKWRKYNVVE